MTLSLRWQSIFSKYFIFSTKYATIKARQVKKWISCKCVCHKIWIKIIPFLRIKLQMYTMYVYQNPLVSRVSQQWLWITFVFVFESIDYATKQIKNVFIVTAGSVCENCEVSKLFWEILKAAHCFNNKCIDDVRNIPKGFLVCKSNNLFITSLPFF